MIYSNDEAETRLIGLLLNDQHSAEEIISKLEPDDFFSPKLKRIFITAKEIIEAGNAVTVPSLSAKLNGQLNIGDLTELLLTQAYHTEVNEYVRLLEDMRIKRGLYHLSQKIQSSIAEKDGVEVISDIDGELSRLLSQKSVDWITNQELLDKQWSILEERKSHDGVIGVSSGLGDLDNLTGGWRKGNLVFIGAVPKSGKTALSLKFALSANVPCLYFTLEMMGEEMADRELSYLSGVEAEKLTKGMINDHDWQKLAGAMRHVNKQMAWVKESGLSVTQIRAICQRYKREHGLGLVVIDQLDKIATPISRGENKADAIGKVTMGLKNMARDLEVPVVVLVQLLDKQIAERSFPRPSHGDIRGSSHPDQDADVILYLWRPEEYYPKAENLKNIAEIIVARQRAGTTGSIWVRFNKKQIRFDSLARDFWPKENDLKNAMRSRLA